MSRTRTTLLRDVDRLVDRPLRRVVDTLGQITGDEKEMDIAVMTDRVGARRLRRPDTAGKCIVGRDIFGEFI